MSDFDAAFIKIVGLEGGYSDRADDPGGKTKYGITERVARENGYVGDMHDMSSDFAEQVYRTSYWDVCHLDQIIAWPLKLFVFDAAVNQGPTAAVRMLQQCLGVADDGVIGPQTISVANRSTGWHAARFMAFRALSYTNDRGFDANGVGWLTRIFELMGNSK